jgi:AraC family transcriptional regulator
MRPNVGSDHSCDLTPADWSGLPLRAASFNGSGTAEGLVTEADTILVWSGGRSEVTIDSGCPHAVSSRHQYSRHSGMIDLMPAGTVLQRVEWQGQRTSCVSASVPRARAHELLRGNALSLGTAPRFGLVDAHIVDLVRRLEEQAVQGQPVGSLYTEALSVTLLSYLSRRYGGHCHSFPEAGSLSPRQREAVIEFVEENLGKDISLADVAALTGYSSDHFSRLFKRSFAQTPHQYLLSRRVERAKAMLLDPSRSLTDVAEACGFSTQAHMNTVFKLRTGLTPGVYRRR